MQGRGGELSAETSETRNSPATARRAGGAMADGRACSSASDSVDSRSEVSDRRSGCGLADELA